MTHRRSFLTRAASVLAVLALAGCVGTASDDGPADIVDTAVGAGQFETLAAALGAAGLVETLKGDGPFTVFAPTDAAFAALPDGTVDSLLLPENRDRLTRILTYHVVAGNYPAASLAGSRGSVPTVAGPSLHIDGRDGVRVEDATVISADVQASNGIIHVIDRVLIPD